MHPNHSLLLAMQYGNLFKSKLIEEECNSFIIDMSY